MPPEAWPQSKYSFGAWYPCSGRLRPMNKIGTFQAFCMRDHGADRSTFTDKRRLFPEASLHRPLHRFDIGSVKDPSKRLEHAFTLDLHSGLTWPHALEQREGLLRGLVRH